MLWYNRNLGIWAISRHISMADQRGGEERQGESRLYLLVEKPTTITNGVKTGRDGMATSWSTKGGCSADTARSRWDIGGLLGGREVLRKVCYKVELPVGTLGKKTQRKSLTLPSGPWWARPVGRRGVSKKPGDTTVIQTMMALEYCKWCWLRSEISAILPPCSVICQACKLWAGTVMSWGLKWPKTLTCRYCTYYICVVVE